MQDHTYQDVPSRSHPSVRCIAIFPFAFCLVVAFDKVERVPTCATTNSVLTRLSACFHRCDGRHHGVRVYLILQALTGDRASASSARKRLPPSI
jgi:hypothetical protein